MSAPPGAMPPPQDAAEPLGPSQRLGAVVAAAVQLVGELLRLLALESRLAGLSLAGILFAALAAAFGVMTAWLLLQAALTVGLTRLGADPLLVLLALTALNALIVAFLLLLIRRLSRNLLFRASIDALFGANRAPPAP